MQWRQQTAVVAGVVEQHVAALVVVAGSRHKPRAAGVAKRQLVQVGLDAREAGAVLHPGGSPAVDDADSTVG